MSQNLSSTDSESPRPAAVETVRGLIEQVADMPVSEDADILLAELEALYTRLEADAARVAELDAANDEAVERIVSLGAMNQRLEGRVIVLEHALVRAEQTIRNLGNGWLTGDGQTIALNEAANIRNALSGAK
jgi:hypothetical protein